MAQKDSDAAQSAQPESAQPKSAQPSIAQKLHRLGLAQRAVGQTDAARASFASAIALAPEDVNLQLSLASLTLAGGDLPQTRRELDAALALDPNQFGAYIALAHLALARGEIDEAQRLLKLAKRLDDEHPQALLIEGQIAMAQRDVERALRLFTQAARLAPDDTMVQSALAVAYLVHGNPAFAEQILRNVLNKRPALHGLRRLLIDALRRQQRLDEAFEQAAIVLSGLPDDVEALAMHGFLAAQLGQRDLALAQLQAAVERDPAHRYALPALQDLWQRSSTTEQAREFLEAQLKRAPNVDALWTARLMYPMDNPQQARQFAERWHAARPDNTQANENLALYCEAADEHERAQELARQALTLDAASLAARMLLHRAELHLDADAAYAMLADRRDVESRADENPESRSQVLRALGIARDRAGRFDAAVQEWLAAHAAHPRGVAFPAPGDLPETQAWPEPAAAVGDAPILLWGAPGSCVERVVQLLRSQNALPQMEDRFGPNARRDGFSRPQDWLADTAHPGTAAGEFARIWRHGVATTYGFTGRFLIDWLPFWDARLLAPLRAQLPGTRLIAIERDPRDMFLHWLAFGAPMHLCLDDLKVAAHALAVALEHLQFTYDSQALPVCRLRYEAFIDAPAQSAQSLCEFLGLAQPLDYAFIAARHSVNNYPIEFAPGRWRQYASVLDGAFARLAPIAVQLGYPSE